MNPILTFTHLGILILGLLGFLALAVATERHAEHLLKQILGRLPDSRLRLTARACGWLLLAVSLAWAIRDMGPGVGIALWLGWLSVAAIVWIFLFPKWPWQPPVREKPVRPPRAAPAGSEPEPPVVPRRRRAVAAVLLVATCATFGGSLLMAEKKAPGATGNARNARGR